MALPLSDVDDSPQQTIVLIEPTRITQIRAEHAALVQEGERELPDQIASPQEYKAVGDLEARLGTYLEKVEPLFDGDDGSVTLARKAWQAACRVRELFMDGPKALKTKCRRLRGDYERREEEARRAQERRLAEKSGSGSSRSNVRKPSSSTSKGKRRWRPRFVRSPSMRRQSSCRGVCRSSPACGRRARTGRGASPEAPAPTADGRMRPRGKQAAKLVPREYPRSRRRRADVAREVDEGDGEDRRHRVLRGEGVAPCARAELETAATDGEPAAASEGRDSSA